MNRIFLAGAACLSLAAIAVAPVSAQNAPFAGQQPPFAGGQDMKDPAVDKLVAAAAKVEKQLAAKPKDSKLKLAAAEAHYKAGSAMMNSPKLSSRTKYRGALKHYRVALKLNPKHAKAADEKKMIEDIYKSMGRPVPG